VTARKAEEALLKVVADEKASEKTVATYYAAAIQCSEHVEFPRVNAAIMKRWGKRVVERVKEKAWAIVEQQNPQPKEAVKT